VIMRTVNLVEVLDLGNWSGVLEKFLKLVLMSLVSLALSSTYRKPSSVLFS